MDDLGFSRVARWLLDQTHLATPDRLAVAVVEGARLLGARDLVLYLVDLEQRVLVPLPEQVGGREPLGIDTTLAGRAFRQIQVCEAQTDDGLTRLWLPLLDGTERLGVIDVLLDEPGDPQLWRSYGSLVAELVMSKASYGDLFLRTRRRQRPSLSTEVLGRLLPPLTFGTRQVVITAVLEPSYDVGGDAFDYAVDGDSAHVAVFDGMGHGLEASLLTAVALAAYRNSRIAGEDLPEMLDAMDRVIAAQFGPERFVTALLAHLDCRTGRLRWLNAGHPAPLLIRGGRVVKTLETQPVTPVGLGAVTAEVAEESLEPGDRVCVYTDGVVEARGPDGEFFGVERLTDFVSREEAAGRPPPETLRRLAHAVLAHQHGQLQDDATTLLVEWGSGDAVGLTPGG